jgi:hypothetical protein
MMPLYGELPSPPGKPLVGRCRTEAFPNLDPHVLNLCPCDHSQRPATARLLLRSTPVAATGSIASMDNTPGEASATRGEHRVSQISCFEARKALSFYVVERFEQQRPISEQSNGAIHAARGTAQGDS